MYRPFMIFCAFCALLSPAAARPTARDAVRLIGKSEAEVVKALGRPVSTRGGEQFHEGTWKLAGATVKFLWWKGGKFGSLSVQGGVDWKSALKKAGLSTAGIKPVLTSYLGVDGYRQKKTFELKGLQGLPKDAFCIWNAAVPDLEFYAGRQ